MEATKPITVVETSPFLRHVGTLLSDDERAAFIDYIARNPEAGALIEGTGGARKVRWARTGGGKSGGVRTIYYYHDQGAPLFLLTVYGKGDKADLSAGDKAAVAVAIESLKKRIRSSRIASIHEKGK